MDWRRGFYFLRLPIKGRLNSYTVYLNIEFLSTARIGDMVKIGMEAIDMGRTSIDIEVCC